MIDKPVLLSGWGGTGVGALIRTKKNLLVHISKVALQHPDGRKMDRPNNLEYLAIDSDEKYENLKFGDTSFIHCIVIWKARTSLLFIRTEILYLKLTKGWISDNVYSKSSMVPAVLDKPEDFYLFININNVIRLAIC